MSIWKKLYGAIFKTPEYLGECGERTVVKKLRRLNFWGYRGRILRNLYVPKSNGETTEIDMVYITKKGIFVVESKNYAGRIFGNEGQQDWLSMICTGQTWLGRRKMEKRYFYNPVWQNRTHIRCLRRYLEEDVPMHSMIVFPQHCELRRIEAISPGVVVCRVRQLPRRIRKIWHRQWRSLTDGEIERIYRELRPLTSPGGAVKRKHIREVRRLETANRNSWLW